MILGINAPTKIHTVKHLLHWQALTFRTKKQHSDSVSLPHSLETSVP